MHTIRSRTPVKILLVIEQPQALPTLSTSLSPGHACYEHIARTLSFRAECGRVEDEKRVEMPTRPTKNLPLEIPSDLLRKRNGTKADRACFAFSFADLARAPNVLCRWIRPWSC